MGNRIDQVDHLFHLFASTKDWGMVARGFFAALFAQEFFLWCTSVPWMNGRKPDKKEEKNTIDIQQIGLYVTVCYWLSLEQVFLVEKVAFLSNFGF